MFVVLSRCSLQNNDEACQKMLPASTSLREMCPIFARFPILFQPSSPALVPSFCHQHPHSVRKTCLLSHPGYRRPCPVPLAEMRSLPDSASRAGECPRKMTVCTPWWTVPQSSVSAVRFRLYTHVHSDRQLTRGLSKKGIFLHSIVLF